MVTLYDKSIQNGKHLAKGFCLSTDTKPTNQIANGSTLTEVDTGDVYIFNEEEEEWVKQFSLQSIGGGGGGSSEIFWVMISVEEGPPVFDKTYSEILAAYNAGQLVLGRIEGSIGNAQLTFASDSGAMIFLYTIFVPDETPYFAILNFWLFSDGTSLYSSVRQAASWDDSPM